MRHWDVIYTEEAEKDRNSLDNSAKVQVLKAIRKVSQNPLPKNEGGYGEPLGHKQGANLTGLCKIKLKQLGLRVVYKVIRDGDIMRIIVIAARTDDEVYKIASTRLDP